MASGEIQMCRFPDEWIFEVVRYGEILQMLSADIKGNMRMWRCVYATSECMLALMALLL